MRAPLALLLGLLLGCPGKAPTLDTEPGPEPSYQTCCCAVESGEAVIQDHLVDVCQRVGGTCVDEARCEAFAVLPCCCITVRGDETRYQLSTWGACVEPGTCQPGDCPAHGGPAAEPPPGEVVE